MNRKNCDMRGSSGVSGGPDTPPPCKITSGYCCLPKKTCLGYVKCIVSLAIRNGFKNGCANRITLKPVLSGHSKLDITKALKTNGTLMKVESIAECSLGAFCNTFDPH